MNSKPRFTPETSIQEFLVANNASTRLRRLYLDCWRVKVQEDGYGPHWMELEPPVSMRELCALTRSQIVARCGGLGKKTVSELEILLANHGFSLHAPPAIHRPMIMKLWHVRLGDGRFIVRAPTEDEAIALSRREETEYHDPDQRVEVVELSADGPAAVLDVDYS